MKIGDLENPETIKVVGANFDKCLQTRLSGEVVDELTFTRRRADGDHRQRTKFGARSAKPSTRASRERKKRTCTYSTFATREEQDQGLVEGKRCQGEASRTTIRPTSGRSYFQNPSLALVEALRRVEVWKDADSSTGGREDLSVFN